MYKGRELSDQQRSSSMWCNKTIAEKSVSRTCRGRMKCCFYNHKISFKHKRHSNKTALSSYMWHLNSVSSETLNLKWSVLRCIPVYSNISEKFPLCLYEKLEIVTYQNQKKLLSKWSELHCKCCHVNKLLLKGLHQ